jgi:hypothetical protein
MALAYIIGAIISLVVLYYVITAAVKQALVSHYKTVRWFEQTGEWRPGPTSVRATPSPFPGAEEDQA